MRRCPKICACICWHSWWKNNQECQNHSGLHVPFTVWYSTLFLRTISSTSLSGSNPLTTCLIPQELQISVLLSILDTALGSAHSWPHIGHVFMLLYLFMNRRSPDLSQGRGYFATLLHGFFNIPHFCPYLAENQRLFSKTMTKLNFTKHP